MDICSADSSCGVTGLRSIAAVLGLGLLLATASARAETVGSSMLCSPQPSDPLARLACGDPTLAKADLGMIQAYYALREAEGADRQPALKAEFLKFLDGTRQKCGIQANEIQAAPQPWSTRRQC